MIFNVQARVHAKGAAKVLMTAATAVMSATSANATDGYFLHGVGARAKGMAGVAIAYPQDSLSVASNPAAATNIGHRFDFGVDVFVPDRKVSISGNAAGPDDAFSGNDVNPFVLPEMGYVIPISNRLTFAMAIYGNGGMNTDYDRNPFARFGAPGEAGIDLKQIFLTPTIAARIVEGHNIGVSAIGVVQSFRAKGIEPFAGASVDPAKLTGHGDDWSFGGGVRVGWLGQLTDRLSAGAFYQTKVWTTKFDKYGGLFADRGGFDVPASWGGGLAYRLTDSLDIGADIKRIEYSDIGSVGNSLAPLMSGVPLGAQNGPGFGWHDITVYKFGAAHRASSSLTLRAGYGRSGQPVQKSETFINILAPGVVQDHFTLGATWTTPAGLEVTGHVLHAPSKTVNGNASIPINFGGGEANVSLGEFSAGISFGFRL